MAVDGSEHWLRMEGYYILMEMEGVAGAVSEGAREMEQTPSDGWREQEPSRWWVGTKE